MFVKLARFFNSLLHSKFKKTYMPTLIVLYLLASWIWDFWPFTGGNFRPISYEHNYNVYFYYPNDREAYLGQVTGLNSCGNKAHNFARDNNMSRSSNWGYICCSIRKGSDCYEKER